MKVLYLTIIFFFYNKSLADKVDEARPEKVEDARRRILCRRDLQDEDFCGSGDSVFCCDATCQEDYQVCSTKTTCSSCEDSAISGGRNCRWVQRREDEAGCVIEKSQFCQDPLFLRGEAQSSESKESQCVEDSEVFDTIGDTIEQITQSLDCFSPLAQAIVKGKGKVSMNQIKVGDQVLTAKGHFEVIYSMDHRDPAKLADFVRVTYDSSTEEEHHLELTKNHMLFAVGNSKPIPAKKLKVGDEIYTVYGPRPIKNISSIIRAGVFNPLTADGTIVVDGIIASTYSTFSGSSDSVEIAGKKKISNQMFFDYLLKPYSFFCTSISFEICKTKNERVLISEYASKALVLLERSRNKDFLLLLSVFIAQIMNFTTVIAFPATIIVLTKIQIYKRIPTN